MPMPAWVLPLAGCKVSLTAVPVVTLSVAVPLVRPVAEAVIVAFPTEAAVKPDLATPLIVTTGDAGLHDPDIPLAAKVTGRVADVTLLPNRSCIVAL